MRATPRFASVFVLFAMLAAWSPTASAQDSNSTPFPGVRRLRRITSTQNINVLFVDLCAPGISMRVTALSERARTVPSFGALVGAQAAVNGGFYNTRDLSMTDGYVVHAGASWGGTDHNYTGPVGFGANRVELLAHEMVAGPQAWVQEAVEGHPTLIDDGAIRDNSGDTSLCPRNPRTAIGLTADRRTLIVAVVDGRSLPSRSGMTCNELATTMQGFGARWALNLDGGGSSTMWLSGTGVTNFPSDGSPRTVSNHLAIYARGTGVAPHCPGYRFKATYVNQTFPLARTTLDLAPGALFAGYIELRNEGTVTWTRGLTRLGTTQPRDRMSMVAGPDWLSAGRPAAVDRMVPPGMTGRFPFTVRAPVTPGEYSEYFGVVQEGVAWFSDPGEGGPADNQLQIRVRTVAALADAGTPFDGAAGDASGDVVARTDTVPSTDAMAVTDTTLETDAGSSSDARRDTASTSDAVSADGADARTGDGGNDTMPAGCGCRVGSDSGRRGARNLGILITLAAIAIGRSRRRRIG